MKSLTTGALTLLLAASAGCRPSVPLSLLLAAPAAREVARVYPGPPRAAHEVGVVAVANSQIHVEVITIDGVETLGHRVFQLLPGERLLHVRCIKQQPRDPFGTWRGREFLQASIRAGDRYTLRTKTTGPGRAGLVPNTCTSWVEDSSTGEVVSETTPAVEPPVPFPAGWQLLGKPVY